MDVAMVLESLASASPNEQQVTRNDLLDVNGDGQIDMGDVAAVRSIASISKQKAQP